MNKVLVFAFMERCHPETNTFYMSFGEMTITLDDVSTLLGIPMIGTLVSIPSDERLSNMDIMTTVTAFLGVVPV